METLDLTRSETIADERLENGLRLFKTGKHGDAMRSLVRAIKECPHDIRYYTAYRCAASQICNQSNESLASGDEDAVARFTADGAERGFWYILGLMHEGLPSRGDMLTVAGLAEQLGFIEIAEYERSFWSN